MKVLVCGGRTYDNAARVAEVLEAIQARKSLTAVIHGAAKGADTLAARWARANGVNEVAFPADWDAYGKGAGHVRNGEMLGRGHPDLVIAFPGGKGTLNMIGQAMAAGVQVLKVDWS